MDKNNDQVVYTFCLAEYDGNICLLNSYDPEAGIANVFFIEDVKKVPMDKLKYIPKEFVQKWAKDE